MNRYIELIQQTFDFPNDEFDVVNGELYFNKVRMMDMVTKYESPLKIHYLPKISQNIQYSKQIFQNAIKELDYKGSYKYAYCTKSSHFSFIMEEVLKNDTHIETSSAFDINIVNSLIDKKLLNKDTYVLCNGYKREQYVKNIIDLHNSEEVHCVPILDNILELDEYLGKVKVPLNVGIRVAADEEPNFNFYTSRLGIAYKNIIPFYNEKILNSEEVKLTTLHFFINTGIKDNAYYWDELNKFMEMYCSLKKICPSLDTVDIGGGFPIKSWLGFEYDYQYMVTEIVGNIQKFCKKHNVEEPNIFTEFGSFTVGESGANLYEVLGQKLQNDKELWYMIDSSFITTLPDTWALEQRYILLPLNLWENEYHTVNIGGLTCDSMDYYNSETHANQVFLPKVNEGEKLYIGLFHTGAYQESLGGFGGIQHCLIPTPKHVVLKNKNENSLFSEEQNAESVLLTLGYKK